MLPFFWLMASSFTFEAWSWDERADSCSFSQMVYLCLLLLKIHFVLIIQGRRVSVVGIVLVVVFKATHPFCLSSAYGILVKMTELVMRSSNGDHRAARDFDEFEVEAEVLNIWL